MARKKAEESIPRPANCFFHFLSDKVKDCKKNGDWNNRSMAVFSREISEMWKEAPQSERDKYIAKALTAKEEHKRRHPDYRYRPRKKSKKMAVSKTGGTNSPPTSASPSSSSTSSSVSTPAPTTPITTMFADGSSTFGKAFGFNLGEASHFNHHIPPGAYVTGLPYAARSDDHSWSPQVAGWTDPSMTISMPQNVSLALLPKSDEALQGLFKTPYYQPHPSYAPQQAFPPFAPGLQLQTGVMNQQPSQAPPQQTSQPAPPQAPQQASQMAVCLVSLPPQAHADAVPAQMQSESLSAMDRLQTTEPEAWDKEFAPLDAGFCDFSSAWNDVKASDTPVSASSATPLPAIEDGPSASAALPQTVADNLSVNVDGDPGRTRALPSQTQVPSLSSPSAFFDPSFLLLFDDPLGQQYNHFYDPLWDLPPSAVWPEELNAESVQM